MERIAALDGLRALSILAVLAAHMLPLGPKPLQLNATAGAMGMTLFFSLSGFLITSNLLSGQTLFEFSIRRLMRILPLAYLYLVIVYLILSYNPHALLAGFLFIENYDVSALGDWNKHFWSLCVEVQFYVLIGLLVATLGSARLWLLVPACAAILAFRIAMQATIHIQTHLRVDEILAGGVVALIHHKHLLGRTSSSLWALPAIFFWIASSSPLTGPVQYVRPYSSALLLIVVLTLSGGPLLRLLSSRLAAYIAAISFALYVIHPATTHGWMDEGSISERYLLKRPVSLAITFILAHISTFYWERRWINLGRSMISRKSLTRPPLTDEKVANQKVV